MAKIKNQPHLIPEPAQKASKKRRKKVRGRPVVKQSVPERSKVTLPEYSTCSDSDFAPRLRQQPKTVKKLSDKIKFKPTVSLPKQPIRRPTKNPTKQPNVSAKLANEPITSTPGPSKRKSEPSQPPNNEPVVISSDESEFEKKPSTSNVNDTAKYTKRSKTTEQPPNNVPRQSVENVPRHSGVKEKSGRSQRQANYAKKRKEAKKAVKDARFGRPAPKKLKAKRLNLGLVSKLYKKQVPGTPPGNTMPRSKPISKPNNKAQPRKSTKKSVPTNEKSAPKKFVKHVLKRRHNDKLGSDEEQFTIVRTLNSFLADTPRKMDLRERFIDDSKVVSKLSIEASFMINLHYVTQLRRNPNFEIADRPKFREFFACLKSTGKGAKYEMMQKAMRPYFTIRHKYGHRLYASENRTNSICMAADTYETCLANNIREHMYRRVRKFFQLMHPTIESYKTLDRLFNWQSEFEGDKVLIASLRKTLSFKGNFHQLNSNWWTYIPFLYRLQQWHVANGTKAFRLFPILQKRRHFVQYDGQAFQQFLRNWELSPCRYSEFEEDEAWRRYFNVDEVESSGHTFSNHIRTDGVSVSITMKRSKRPDADRATALAQAKAKLERNEIKNVRAYDPGHRLIFAGIDRDLARREETSIKYSSRSYQYASGRHRYQAAYNRIANPLLRKLQVEREALPNGASPVLDVMEFLNFELKNFSETNDVLMNEPITKLRFRRYVSRQKATSELAKALVGSRIETTNTIVFCGSTEQNPIIKGYIRTPNSRIFAEVKRLAPLTFRIDEFRSTMLCSRCFAPATTSQSPHRWQHCNKCKVNWNRDINAGRNICYLGLNEVMGLQTNRGFSRLFNFPGTAKDYQHLSKKPKPHTRRDTIKQRKLMRTNRKTD